MASRGPEERDQKLLLLFRCGVFSTRIPAAVSKAPTKPREKRNASWTEAEGQLNARPDDRGVFSTFGGICVHNYSPAKKDLHKQQEDADRRVKGWGDYTQITRPAEKICS